MSIAIPSEASFEIVHLETVKQLSRFNCGVPQIDKWAKNSAHKLHDRDRHRVYVMRESGGVSVVAFFSLSLTQESASKLTNPDDRQAWSRGAPFVYLDYIGVLQSMQGQGIGQVLLTQAMKMTHELSLIAPAYGLALRSLNLKTTAFYKKRAFGIAPGEETEASPLMILPIFTIKELISGGRK